VFTNRCLGFSLVLATIITALTNFIKPDAASEADATDLKGSGDMHEEAEDDKILENEDIATQNGNHSPPSVVSEDEDDEIEEGNEVDTRLPKVLKAFQCLRRDFDGKFKQMWA
jgi:hypothetical protein